MNYYVLIVPVTLWMAMLFVMNIALASSHALIAETVIARVLESETTTIALFAVNQQPFFNAFVIKKNFAGIVMKKQANVEKIAN